jgi:hypothetical protein
VAWRGHDLFSLLGVRKNFANIAKGAHLTPATSKAQ